MSGGQKRSTIGHHGGVTAVGKSVVRVDEVGAGNIAKLVYNMIVGATFAIIAEGFGLAVLDGVEPQPYEAMRDGWGRSKGAGRQREIANRSYVPGGTIDMLEKVLSYARGISTESRSPIPLRAAAHELLVAGQAAGHGGKSQPALFERGHRDGHP